MKRDKRTAAAQRETQSKRRKIVPAVRRSGRASAKNGKVSALETTAFFTDRKAKADFKAFGKILKRKGGEPPRKGDEMPSKPVARITLEETRRLAQVRAAMRGLRKLQKQIARRNPEPITDKEIRDAMNE